MVTPEFARDAARTECACCLHVGIEPVLDMGMMPRSDGLLPPSHLHRRETLVPLRLGFCAKCSMVQLLETRPAEEMFGDDYPYMSSYSDALLKHSRENALELIEMCELGADDLVVEIASNDGYMLRNFKESGIPVLGIDPALQPVTRARESGIDTIQDFFGLEVATRLVDEGRRANVMIANNVVAHVADQNDLVAGFAKLLADDGMLVVEFPYVRDLIDYGEFDTIYHEHRCYFSLTSAMALFSRHGLYVNDVRRLSIHGGSLRLFIGKSERPTEALTKLLAEEEAVGLNTYAYYEAFAAQVADFRLRARKMLGDMKAEGRRIAAYGAAAKGTIMLNFLGVGRNTIAYAVDRNTFKQGRYIPGVRVPICDPSRLTEDKPDVVLILPWNFKDEIISQQQDYLASGGKFVVPIPNLEIVSA
ncbi:MAG: class I SAM-dependent methyltransferase [Pseudomonadota bacterium]